MSIRFPRLFSRIFFWLQQLYLLPPKTSARKIIAKMRRQRDDCTEEIFDAAPKYTQPQRMTNFLLRYERIIARHRPARQIDFAGKRAIEIGGGPFFGWGLFAIFMGCERYVCVEPFFNSRILSHPKARHFFLLTYKDLSALFGERMSYPAFTKAIAERIVVYKKYIEDFSEENNFDILLSNSTLEHIHDLDATFSRLRACAKPDASFLHVVDFGNHRDAMNPLQGLYADTPEAYRRRHGGMITLRKAPDILAAADRHGFSAELIPYYSIDAFPEPVASWWRERYHIEDLLLKVGLFIDKRA